MANNGIEYSKIQPQGWTNHREGPTIQSYDILTRWLGLSECLMFDDVSKTFTCIMSGRWNFLFGWNVWFAFRVYCLQMGNIIRYVAIIERQRVVY